jgi:hypothetical protein
LPEYRSSGKERDGRRVAGKHSNPARTTGRHNTPAFAATAPQHREGRRKPRVAPTARGGRRASVSNRSRYR